mmetsp:Transcript_32457/g.23988  ORF Transcript_32457/g.23988 Transcript_32457/m.23988 type:complete len:150 (+) Transcript_32457:371-820(+)
MLNMVSSDEGVCSSSSNLMNAICHLSRPSEIVLILMDILREHRQQLKVVIAALEVLVVLLKEENDYCNKNANVLETCLKIVEILQDNSNNMDVIMPSIAVMLAMRDKNFDGMMKALVFLKSNQLNLVRKLFAQFAPDFENDILKNVLNE